MEDYIRDQIKSLIAEYFRLKKQRQKFVPGESFIQYSGDVTGENEIIASVESLLDGRLAAGKRVDTFEREFAKYIGTNHAVSVHSGSAADMLAFSALTNYHLEDPIKKGDEVITCGLSFSTTVTSIVFNNLKPVFVDAKLPEYTIDEERVEDAITEKTRAILAVHIFGNACNLDKIMKIAKEHNLYVVEDCCDSAGTLYDGKKIGSFCDMGTFSFYPAHQMTTMEGGCITTNSDIYSYTLKSLKTWGRAINCPFCGNDFGKKCPLNHHLYLNGMENYDPAYLFINMGHNSKITEVQAAFGLEQLKVLDHFNEIRKNNFHETVKALRPYEDKIIIPRAEKNSEPAWYSIPITVKPESGFKRAELAEFLAGSKIEYRYLFTGNILKQPGFREIDCRIHGDLKNADLTTTNSLFIGCYQGITDEMRGYVIEKLAEFMEKH